MGSKAANELTANDDSAPRPTKVFMFGEFFIRLFKPSRISWRPGPSNVNKDKDIWNPVEWSVWIHGAVAPTKWERWPTKHTAHNAQETASCLPVKKVQGKFL